jgi:hypothetical protein
MSRKFYNFRNPKLWGALLAIIFILGLTFTAISRSNGSMTGLTATNSEGCSCHGTSSNSNTSLTVESSSGNFELTPGSTGTYTITVSNSSESAAGIDIAVKTTETGSTNAGTLSPTTGSGLQTQSSELTHSTPKSLNNGSIGFTFTWTAPSTHGVYYLRAVGNAVNLSNSNSGDQWNWMTPKQITVKGVTLTSPNGGQQWCVGSTQSITWEQTGLTNVKIELSSDGGGSYPTVITQSTAAGTGSYSWNIPTDIVSGTQFKVRISDASNSSNFDVGDGVFTIGGAPQITQNPQSLTACSGSQISFSVTATGAGLGYQWRKNGTNIQGATQSSLNIQNVQLSAAGNYDCVVTGSCGNSVGSTVATLSVDETPSISQQPASTELCPGGSASFSVTASGTEITYQWRKNSENIPNATTSSYQISNVKASDAGSYTCMVSGKCQPPIISSPAFLTVNEAPQITSEPTDRTICSGTTTEFRVIAKGSNLSYQWRKNGQSIPNANSDLYTISKVAAQDSGSYDCIVRGTCVPEDTSAKAILKVKPLPVVSTQPSGKTVIEGGSISLTTAGTGDIKSYQWRKNEVNMQNATNATLTLNSVKLSDSGSYDCILTNDCGSVNTIKVLVQVTKAGPGPVLSLSDSEFDFGTILLTTPKDTTIQGLITNNGSEALTITNISIGGPDAADFIVQGMNLPLTLSPAQSKDLSIRFQPSLAGTRTAQMTFTSNAPSNPVMDLRGFAGFVRLEKPEELLFGQVEVGSIKETNLSILNSGNIAVTLTNFNLSGDGASDYIIPASFTEVVIEPENTYVMTIGFNPKAEGESTAFLNYTIKEDNSDGSVKLSGNGIITDVDEFILKAGLEIFPNPVDDELSVHFGSTTGMNSEIIIFNNLGEEVVSKRFTSEKVDWIWNTRNSNVSESASGIYLLIIRLGDRTITKTIIINK